MTGKVESPWPRYEPQDCSDEEMHALRAFLEGIDAAASADPRRALFRDCFFVRESDFAADAIRLLDRLGLISRQKAPPGYLYATAAIVCVAGASILCDRGGAPDCSNYPLPADTVYPPIFANAFRYLTSLPSTPCDAFLELGTGTGIAAILGTRHARRVWATDITPRSVDFARWNCRLAGLDNVTVLEGDLYQPVEGLDFDRIAIHPPWAPASLTKFVFGDGGDDGETILRRTIEGLPRFLRRGGRFYATMLASDREGDTFEQRVRRWLGGPHGEFDIALLALSRDSPDEFLAHNLAGGSIAQSDIPIWRELWETTRTEAIVYGNLIVQRCAEGRQPVTKRLTVGDCGGRRVEAMLDRETKAPK